MCCVPASAYVGVWVWDLDEIWDEICRNSYRFMGFCSKISNSKTQKTQHLKSMGFCSKSYKSHTYPHTPTYRLSSSMVSEKALTIGGLRRGAINIPETTPLTDCCQSPERAVFHSVTRGLRNLTRILQAAAIAFLRGVFCNSKLIKHLHNQQGCK